VPITASIVAFGVSSPASAWVVQNGCGSYRVCFYGNTDFGPSSAVLNIAREYVPSYVAITPGASVACTQGAGNGHDWNDCASSVKDKMTAYDTCAYANVDYVQPKLLILHGEQIANLGQYGFNDIISSSHYTSVPSC
jgi:hypothetical protein